jgi:TolB-like protein
MSIVSGLAVATILVFFFDRQIGLPSSEPPPPAVDTSIQLPPIGENTIAVLPFVNLDGSNETQIFADGLVEDVITQLSRVPGLRVAARGDSYTLQPNSASQEVRNRLRVAIYLEGSVQLSKGIMRVTVQMIDSASGFHNCGEHPGCVAARLARVIAEKSSGSFVKCLCVVPARH